MMKKMILMTTLFLASGVAIGSENSKDTIIVQISDIREKIQRLRESIEQKQSDLPELPPDKQKSLQEKIKMAEKELVAANKQLEELLVLEKPCTRSNSNNKNSPRIISNDVNQPIDIQPITINAEVSSMRDSHHSFDSTLDKIMSDARAGKYVSQENLDILNLNLDQLRFRLLFDLREIDNQIGDIEKAVKKVKQSIPDKTKFSGYMDLLLTVKNVIQSNYTNLKSLEKSLGLLEISYNRWSDWYDARKDKSKEERAIFGNMQGLCNTITDCFQNYIEPAKKIEFVYSQIKNNTLEKSLNNFVKTVANTNDVTRLPENFIESQQSTMDSNNVHYIRDIVETWNAMETLLRDTTLSAKEKQERYLSILNNSQNEYTDHIKTIFGVANKKNKSVLKEAIQKLIHHESSDIRVTFISLFVFDRYFMNPFIESQFNKTIGLIIHPDKIEGFIKNDLTELFKSLGSTPRDEKINVQKLENDYIKAFGIKKQYDALTVELGKKISTLHKQRTYINNTIEKNSSSLSRQERSRLDTQDSQLQSQLLLLYTQQDERIKNFNLGDPEWVNNVIETHNALQKNKFSAFDAYYQKYIGNPQQATLDERIAGYFALGYSEPEDLNHTDDKRSTQMIQHIIIPYFSFLHANKNDKVIPHILKNAITYVGHFGTKKELGLLLNSMNKLPNNENDQLTTIIENGKKELHKQLSSRIAKPRENIFCPKSNFTSEEKIFKESMPFDQQKKIVKILHALDHPKFRKAFNLDGNQNFTDDLEELNIATTSDFDSIAIYKRRQSGSRRLEEAVHEIINTFVKSCQETAVDLLAPAAMAAKEMLLGSASSSNLEDQVGASMADLLTKALDTGKFSSMDAEIIKGEISSAKYKDQQRASEFLFNQGVFV